MPTAYDSVRYPGWPYPQTDPAGLGVLAKLYGLPFAPSATARVLEIGCGDGINLINLALASPGARFLGLDLAETAIASAQADAAACGLANVEFVAADLRDLGPEYGAFDYVIAHGVLSWVPEPVRACLFKVIGERLAPGGLAMVSFAALPGARSLQAIRDLLAYETRGATSPRDKLNRATAALEGYLKLWSEKDADTAHMIGAARRVLAHAPEAMFHDELGEAYQPLLLADVAAAAAENGMLYFADAHPRAHTEALFPSEGAAQARQRAGGDWTRFQQYLDFQDMRSFHNAVFVKGGAPDRRRCPGRLDGLWIQCELTQVEGEADVAAFVTGAGVRLSTNDRRLAALFGGLANAYPQALRLGDDPELADHVFRLFTSEIARFTTSAPRARRDAGPRPLASALARRQVARGERDLATLMQSVAHFDDDPLLPLIALLNGTRGRDELAQAWAAAAGSEAAGTPGALDRALGVLARAGLLLDPAG